MIDDYYQLQQQYRDKCDDYDNEVTSRRHWQSSVAELKVKFQVIRQQTVSGVCPSVHTCKNIYSYVDHFSTDSSQESSPFVLALIVTRPILVQTHDRLSDSDRMGMVHYSRTTFTGRPPTEARMPRTIYSTKLRSIYTDAMRLLDSGQSWSRSMPTSKDFLESWHRSVSSNRR